MPTNLALDDSLIVEAKRLGNHKTKKAAVTAALEEYIKRRLQLTVREAYGRYEFDPKYDYKAERKRKTDRWKSW
jgi:Arc/MetJ family transcription regulator